MDMHVKSFQDLVWSDDLALGIDGIDDEHKQWIALVQAFQAALAEGHSKDEVARTLTEAVAYTERHFASEQAVMEEAGYPFLADHMLQHELAWEQVHAFTEGNMPEESIAAYLADFLPQWLMLHINSADRQFARWLKEHNGEPVEAEISGRVFANIPV